MVLFSWTRIFRLHSLHKMLNKSGMRRRLILLPQPKKRQGVLIYLPMLRK